MRSAAGSDNRRVLNLVKPRTHELILLIS